MLRSISTDIQDQFRMGNNITRLILINLFVFLTVTLICVFTNFGGSATGPTIYDTIVEWLALNSDMVFNAWHPWVFLTHMFLHVGFWHIFWNMLLLYWFGRIVGDLLGDHRIIPLYLLGGLAGALAYLLFATIFNQAGYALGASGAVMAIAVAAGTIAPDYNLRLLLIGNVRLKYVVAVLILIDVVGLGGMDNTGGHFAHLGGAAFGWYFVFCLRRGLDFSVYVNRLFEMIQNLFAPPPKVFEKGHRTKVMVPKGREKYWGEKMKQEMKENSTFQDQVDAILEKIHTNGFESLTEEEKEILYRASKE